MYVHLSETDIKLDLKDVARQFISVKLIEDFIILEKCDFLNVNFNLKKSCIF